MIITLYLNDRLINFRLPTYISGSYSFDFEENEINLINIEAQNNEWVLYAIEDLEIYENNRQVKKTILKENQYYLIKRNEAYYLIFITNPNYQKIKTYEYLQKINLLIGDMGNINIKINCPYFQNILYHITYQPNIGLQIENKGQSNLYINNETCLHKVEPLKIGDEINFYGLRIIILSNLFLIITPNNSYEIVTNNANINEHAFIPEENPKDIEIKDIDLYNPNDYYSKSPRIRRTIEEKNISISPPPEEKNTELPLILVVGPMLTMGVSGAMMFASSIFNIVRKTTTLAESWPQLIMSGAMLVSMLVWPLLTHFYNLYSKKKKHKTLIKKYNQYLEKKEKTFSEEMELQKIILLENLITIEECLKTINNKTVNFWDKRTDQNDFLTLRLGIGNALLKVKVDYNEEDFKIEESKLREQAENLIKKYKYIANVPIGYSFSEHFITAIMGNYKKTIAFVNNLILQILTFYTYEDIKIVLFTNEQNAHNWEYIKYLNHNFSDDKSIRFFSTNKENAKIIAEYLEFEVNNRINIKSENNSYPKPYYIIIIDDEDVKKFDFINDISENDENNMGFSLIFIENKLSKLPSKCSNFITIGEKNSEVLINAYENQEKINFIDEIHYNIDMMNIVKILANVPIEYENSLITLPDSVNFLEMEKVGKVEQLNILNRWERNDPTISLKAEVGVDEQGDILYLDLHEKNHGPHGLIAGTTGSGKSEFIITYILSMAINYSPEEVSFILIDYKGGGLTYAFENKSSNLILPHLAGTITNLDKSEIDRALVSINSEIKRRQVIFNEAKNTLRESTMDIYKYQRYYNEGRLNEPITHLLIICDEFAELKTSQPDFMDDLISVARIGRSLGVHLILATQKPSGVVNEQIWSNTRFRVCLKVSDEQDSREMLKRPEAAAIKQTGRFYLQVGYDEYFVLGQSAYAGATYYPAEKIIKQVDKSLNFIDNCGLFIKNIQASNNINVKPQGEQLPAILNNIISVAESLNMKSRRLWLESLPEEVIIDNLKKKYNYQKKNDIEIIIGEYDAPQYQQQNLVTYSYLNNGNTIIYGNDGSENENFLNTFIYETANNYKAEEINFYLIDYGSESLVKYAKLPHVGGLVLSLEEEKYNNLLKLIKDEIQLRKKILFEYNGDFKIYNEKSPKKLPIKVVIFNNFDSIYEANQNLYDDLPYLVRDSERYGIIFIITANSISSVHSKISQNFPNIITFKLKDESDYRVAFDIHSKLAPKNIFGRGLIKIKDEVFEFQTAIPISSKENVNLEQFIQEQLKVNQKIAKKIPVLPEKVRFNDISSELKEVSNLPIAISKNELNILSIDFKNNLGYLIASNKLDNSINLTKSLIEEIKYFKSKQLIIIDSAKELLLNRLNYPNYYTDDFENLTKNLIEYINNLINQKSNIEGVIIIFGLDKYISKIPNKELINDLFKTIKNYEKLYVIAVESIGKLKNYTYENWFQSLFSLNDGIWVGKGIIDQSLFHVSKVTKEMTKDYDNEMGFIISENTPILCKFIDYISKED